MSVGNVHRRSKLKSWHRRRTMVNIPRWVVLVCIVVVVIPAIVALCVWSLLIDTTRKRRDVERALTLSRHTVRCGYAFMRRQDVVVCGITRNNAATLPHTLDLIDRMGALFRTCRVILYENDSSDTTCDVIRAWQCKRAVPSDVTFVSEKLKRSAADATGSFSNRRFEIIAQCRNRCVEELRKSKFDNVDYVVFLDMDLSDLPLDGVAHSFGLHNQWDAVTANGVFDGETYYDALAFRSEDATFSDTRNNVKQRCGAQRIYPVLIGKDAAPLVPVASAFGGLGIYKRACLLSCPYRGTDCEHVTLHACQRNTDGCARIRMNPLMRMYYDTKWHEVLGMHAARWWHAVV